MTKFLTRLTTSIEPLIGAEALPCAELVRSSSLEERASLRVNRREIQRQMNIERIVELAAAEMPAEVAEAAIARDWLIQFLDVAQDISEENCQRIWARLLAIYIASPDAIFKRTLIQLRNMDQWELDAFVEYCSFVFAFESGWHFAFEEELTRQEMWGYVRGNDYTQHFINIGLLSQETLYISPIASRGLRIRYFEKEYELIAPPTAAGENTPAIDPHYGYRRFTAAGQQLAKAVRAKIFYGYARNLIQTLSSERGVQFKAIETTEEPFSARG